MDDMLLIGQFLKGCQQQMIIKYGADIPAELIQKNITRLTNQLWKIIPMRE
jgi:hypothetical protein